MDNPNPPRIGGEIPDSPDSEVPLADCLLNRTTPDRFDEWHDEREYAKNIENGTPYFNEAGYQPDSERHSPSKLLRCHRRQLYSDHNAPEEEPDPSGIFWTGSKLEEELLLPFLKDTAADLGAYVQNSIWVDYSIDTHAGPLQFKGSTDPVIVDAEATPILPTEIKTRATLDNLTSPNRTHRAQLHAYLVGLSEEYGIELRTGLIVYVSRESLDIQTFRVDFDEAFWEDVLLEWAATHTQHRLEEELPPATPEDEWECEYCSYRERCGEGDRNYSDATTTGLLPGYTGYPREKLVAYFRAYPDARLTPSLAFAHPDLVDDHGVYDWECSECDASRSWNSVEWDGNVTQPPRCPDCPKEGAIAVLRGPAAGDQLQGGDECETA
ncbi:CRISPR-associated protein Cas4 [Halobacterium rubrum]|uniref:CRISPR-associated protein Cas4 n=1 Tax=Halobacterium TaxID=2239 RepID=UPI001F3247F9|nr:MULTISPECIES: PD-(D/E)XK nuclease family protein [Halobacterium]MDH5020368.1 Dna2/Cas4 domain-containing protein [Halobacterium rubrum]